MSQTVTEVLRAQQAANDKPRQLTVQTIHISSVLQRDKMDPVESPFTLNDHTSRGGMVEKEAIESISNIEMVFREKLLEQNSVEENLREAFRYKLGLVRLIGDPAQSNSTEVRILQNLQFLLQHEPKFKTTVDKHWILNRISNEDFLEQTKRILNVHNQTFSVLPFDIGEYDSLLDQSDDARKKMLKNDDKSSQSRTNQKQRSYLDESFGPKFVYLTNQNNARNFALSLYNGKQKENHKFEIDYILPWDGDCFLSQSAHDSLQRDLKRHNDEQQQRIAKARNILRKEVRADDDLNNEEGLDDDFVDNELSNLIESRGLETLLNAPIKYFHTPVEKFEQSPAEFKPIQYENDLQLVFHRTAKARFDSASPSMTWMLKKLKIRGPWDIGNPIRPVQKDFNFHQFSILSSSNNGESSDEEKLSLSRNDDTGSPAVGWVTRLFSSHLTPQPEETPFQQTRAIQQIKF